MERSNISSVHLEGHFHWMIVRLTSNWRKRVIIYQVINRNGESLLLLLFFFFIFFNFNLIIDAQEFNWLVTGYTVYEQWITSAVKVKTTKKHIIVRSVASHNVQSSKEVCLCVSLINFIRKSAKKPNWIQRFLRFIF